MNVRFITACIIKTYRMKRFLRDAPQKLLVDRLEGLFSLYVKERGMAAKRNSEYLFY